MHRKWIALVAFIVLVATADASMPKTRSFDFDYQVIVKDIPDGALELKLWIPFLPDKAYQNIDGIIIDPSDDYILTQEPIYNNKMLVYTLKAPFKKEYNLNVHYKIKRSEYSSVLNTESEISKYLKPNKLVTMSPKIVDIAKNIIMGKESTIEKARAIYDYVYENVSYDKTIPGWGEGDTERVCNLKAGNCTDFHSLFISLSRASGIPARFIIGAPFSDGQLEGTTTKYHCWAEFFDEQTGWVPVDISEAWKDKSKHDYYFGTVGEDRLEFSMGRDIVLEPKQKGSPLNYFVYPYAELDGQVFKNIGVLFKYKITQGQQG